MSNTIVQDKTEETTIEDIIEIILNMQKAIYNLTVRIEALEKRIK